MTIQLASRNLNCKLHNNNACYRTQGKYRKTFTLEVRRSPAGLDSKGGLHSKGISTIRRVCSTTDVSKFPLSLPVRLPGALPQFNASRVLALALQHLSPYRFPQMLGPLPKLPRTWSDVVPDLAREPNTLRMAALMKELTQVDPKMFSDASREGPGGKLKWACTQDSAPRHNRSPSKANATNWIRSDRYLRRVHIAPHQGRIQKESQP
jgi:hypothetical protein